MGYVFGLGVKRVVFVSLIVANGENVNGMLFFIKMTNTFNKSGGSLHETFYL